MYCLLLVCKRMIVPGRLIGTVYATSGTLALRVPSVVPSFFLVTTNSFNQYLVTSLLFINHHQSST